MTILEQAQTFSSRLGPRALATLRWSRNAWERARVLGRAVLQAVRSGTPAVLESLRDIGTETAGVVRETWSGARTAAFATRECFRTGLDALGEIPAFPGLLGRGARTAAHGTVVITLRIPRGWRVAAATVAALALAFIFEAHTGLFEATVFSALASRLEWSVGQGPSPSIVYPQSGPFDIERGYSQIPEFTRRLTQRGYRIREQARFSSPLAMLARAGLSPPWREPPSEGLVIRDATGDTLFRGGSEGDMITSYDELPPIVVQTLLYIENRGITDPEPTTNPAVDWPRFAKATGLWAGRRVGLPLPVEGGSTLAVQLEKLRHFSGGRTRSPADKLRQIAAASLRAYRFGPDTRSARRDIILGYLNSAPLAATPGHGEIRGVAEGLRRWFGRNPHRTLHAIAEPASIEQQARAYRAVLALICALRAPTRYLVDDRAALESRMNFYTDRLEENGVLSPELAAAVRATPLALEPARRSGRDRWLGGDKSADAIRGEVASLLGVRQRYALDRLDLDVESTVDGALERRVHEAFRTLGDRDSVAAFGLMGEHLLPTGDPAGVTYSLLLLESAPRGGYRVCAHVDNLNQPFDPVLQMKMDLGSTAKLRTLAHYLQVMEGLHGDLARLDADSLRRLARAGRDPLTRWAAATLDSVPGAPLETFLRLSLERVYSASPYEAFFTGGGLHSFHNFDPDDNGRRLTIHEALVKSTNLVFVRLMRDLERYHQARLPYNADSVLADPDHPERRRLLALAEEDESRQILFRAWSRWRAVPPESLVARMLPPRRANAFRAAVVYGAWGTDTSAAACAAWIGRRIPGLAPDEALATARKVASRNFTLLDEAYLLRMHPLELWCAGELVRHPGLGWSQLWAASGAPRRVAQAWLLDPRHRRAQDLRLRVQIEKEAFARMAPAWRRLGFPFKTLVPSYATAIGASGDRPIALAKLMGIIVDGGLMRPSTNIRSLRLASGTPYQTDFEAGPAPALRVMSPTVARVLRSVLAEVPERGTARRLAGAFKAPDGTLVPVAGKTGSGDNRYHSFARGGRLISSRPVNRTAVFTFALGERHFGVITATVDGPAAGAYSFTSALPVAVLRLLAPAIGEHLAASRDSSFVGAHAVARVRTPPPLIGPPAPSMPRPVPHAPETVPGVMASLPR